MSWQQAPPPVSHAYTVQLYDRLPLFKKQQEAFDQELLEYDTEKVVELGTNKEQDYEGREKHIVDALKNKTHIPTKTSIVEQNYTVQGYIPESNYQVFDISKPKYNILYDFTKDDYLFLESQENKISENCFEFLMTVFDLMFPYKYHNITVDVNSLPFQYIQQTVNEVAKNPQYYQLNFDQRIQDDIQPEFIQSVYQHYCNIRERCQRQPLIPHLSPEHTKKEKVEYFRDPNKKQGKINQGKLKQYMNITLLYNMLGEYALSREILNQYHLCSKYYEGLQIIQQETGEHVKDYDLRQIQDNITVCGNNGQQHSLTPINVLCNNFIEKEKISIPNIQINPVYQHMFPFKPYLSSEQLRKQYERTMESYKDLFKPQKDTKGIVQNVKKETNEFLQFYNEVMDCVEDQD